MKKKQISFWKVFIYWLKGIKDKMVLYITVKVFGLFLAVSFGILYRQRMSHNNGIGGRGSFKVVDNPKFPEHDFFTAGRTFPCRIRHGAAAFYDDAMNTVRSISVKLSDNDFKSPFDMEMNTGKITFFWSAISFIKFAMLRKEKYGIDEVEYFKKYPIAIKGAQASLRRNPTSFQNMHYYSKTPFQFIGKDGILRYVKYRVIPADDEKETGINTGRDLLDTNNQRVIPGESRSRNYLKDEYKERVHEKGAQYRMQIQLRISSNDDNPIIFNDCIEWDDEVYNWIDLGIINIHETLNWSESNRLTFSFKNLPKTLAIIPAKSIYDYNSVNYMRANTGIAARARLLSYKLFGMPPEIPYNDNRNSASII